MNRVLLGLFYLTGMVYSKNVPLMERFGNVKIKKSLQRSINTGSMIGASIPVVKEVQNIPHHVLSTKAEIEQKFDAVDVVLPHEYTTHTKILGEEWSYSTFINNIVNHNLYGASLSQDGTYAVAIENIHSSNIGQTNLHYVTIMPIHITHLIDLLVVSDINFDIIQ